MRKGFISGAIAVLALGTIAIPASARADGGGGNTRRVRLQDNCDPVTFDAVVGPGTCVPHGDDETVTFGEFVAALNPVTHVGHEDWNFKPNKLDLEVGDSIRAVVRGGEFHSFTEVTEFGPGCVDFLNAGLGLTGPPVVDCANLDATGVVPGGQLIVSGLAAGTHKFMCGIHPWMQTVVTVGADDD